MRVLRAAMVAVSGLGIVLAVPTLAHTVAHGSARRTAEHGDVRHRASWVWPFVSASGVSQPDVVRGFEPPAQRWQQGHRGVDLLGTVGEEVRAAGAGTVSFAGVLFGRPVVAVDHTAPGRDTLRTTYEPVDPVVKVGQKVGIGEVVGHLAPDATDPAVGHCAPRACLHWGLVRGFGHDARYLDPSGLLRHGPVRLLPVWGHR